MHEKKQARRSARDRRPNEVPHHPKIMTIAMIVALVAIVVMVGWFWMTIAGQSGLFTSAPDNESISSGSTVQVVGATGVVT